MQTIKSKHTGLGKNGYEQYLIKQHYKETQKLLEDWNVHHEKITIIMGYHKHAVKTENIKALYTHPITTFLNHLVDGTLDKLFNYTSSTNNAHLKKQMVRDNIQEWIEFKILYAYQTTYSNLVTDFYLMKKGFRTLSITIK